MNPYAAIRPANPPGSPARAEAAGWARHTGRAVAACVLAYYILSSMTLPFADDLWLGELPVLAVVQLPKLYAMQWFQDGLIAWLPLVGLDSGSPSPDLILTHPWALALTVAVPPLILLGGVTGACRRGRRRRRLIAAIFVVTLIDAAATYWFDAASRLSLF